ncbi:exoprotein [Aurantiacibacter atlanticus]|uniref:Exoprotein n=2 Tax=Aurantiacibacter atlanticus TaxID=1648404 RepID=A0A0H4VJV1_9SPHN|nr:exoprotein [Aurantiacibacter atlanticus]
MSRKVLQTMVQDPVSSVENRHVAPKRGRKRRWLRNGFYLVAALIMLALVAIWLQRKEIADSFIADIFAQNDVRATYSIDSISPQKQVLSNIVIGDPASPDLTIERLELGITPRFGIPDLTTLLIVRPRIFGSYRDGELSFGDLDPLIFTGEGGPFEFPDAELLVDDGRGLLQTDYGRIGLKFAGGGHLRGGFSAKIAAVADKLAFPDCSIERPTLYGEISIDAERPGFTGPLRFVSLACPAQSAVLKEGALEINAQADRNLVDFQGDYALALGSAAFADAEAKGTSGEGTFTSRDGVLYAFYDLSIAGLTSPSASANRLTLQGSLRGAEEFAQLQADGDLAGTGLALGPEFDAQIASAIAASEGTLAAPLLSKLRRNLSRELRGSSLAASFDARQSGGLTNIVIPEARLRGSSGASVVALSRAELGLSGAGLPRFSGNIATGGAGLPQISGRMAQSRNGALELRFAMREYAAGDARLSVPQLTVLQGRDGRMALEGSALASGPLPGGFAHGLVVPLDGTVARDGTLSLWNGCREVRFERLKFSNLALGRQALTLCPPSGRSILRFGSGGLALAAGATSLNLTGELAQTSIRLRSGAVGFAWPGAMSARDLDIELGPPGEAQRFTITDLRADLSAEDIGGDFAGADIFLASVPLDVLNSSGQWRYADDRLTLSDAGFTLEDRGSESRFQPLIAQGATLTLFDNFITANALLQHPESGKAISRAEITHDLATGSGKADLFVDGITFGPGFQPLDLTRLALGVVANVDGTVTGTGHIAWNDTSITSNGEFSSESLDLAAAFGPVKGASGSIVFTDLLGLTTAPDQRISVGSINPGIEVTGGEVGFQLTNGELLAVTGGSWPFMGGTLSLRAVDINIGVAESRTYVMEIAGLEASRFVEQMELGNIAATGIFDGTIPIVFDADGNGRLVNGELISRPPGGHLSYIGELSYEDMSFFANYAFAALRDLRYDSMDIEMNGPLTGELVTQVRFTGIGQGETAESNIVTRALANLPIDLRINIRAPFYKLITSIRAMYDPAALRDPRDLGLLTDDGARLRETIDQQTVDKRDEAAAEAAERQLLESLDNDEPGIQPQESEPAP